MTRTRLDIEFSDLVAEIRAADDDRRRKVAQSVTIWCLEFADLRHERAVRAALEALDQGRFGDSPDRAALLALVDSWEVRQEQIAQELDSHREGPERDGYDRAFVNARAANALWYALDEDPLDAAAEAAYEAWHVRRDAEALRRVVRGALEH